LNIEMHADAIAFAPSGAGSAPNGKYGPLLLNGWRGSRNTNGGLMRPQEFEAAFPRVMSWIERTLSSHRALIRPVASKGFKRLPLYFSEAHIDAAKFAAVGGT
jgi:hypothetical protein